MYKIIIADDHPIVRNGLRQIISDEKDLTVSAEAANADQLFEELKTCEYDLIILDIAMPGLSGIDALVKVKNVQPDVPVLMLSALSEDLYAVRTIKAGASGYMHKESAAENLIEAIRKILNGGIYVSAAIAEKLVHDLQTTPVKSIQDLLSVREFQIMRLIATGKTVGDIAELLSLSVTTISTYRKRILEKMDLQNNAELTYYCVKNGLVD